MKMTEQQRNDFIKKNAGTIGKHAKVYVDIAKQYGYQYDDIYNTGVIGMIEGIEEYDIVKATKENGRVVPLEAWVHIHVQNHMSSAFGKHRTGDRLKNKVSMDKKIYNNDGSSTTVGDMMTEEEHKEDLGQSIDREKVIDLLNSGILSETEKIAIEERFLNGLKLREINQILQKHLNNPKAKAFYFINTAMDKLRKALEVA